MTTEAFGTAAMMRLRMRVARNWRSLPLIVGSPSVWRNSSLISGSDIFLPLVPLPILEEVVGGGDHREDRDDGPEQLERDRADERQEHRRVAGNDIAQPSALQP